MGRAVWVVLLLGCHGGDAGSRAKDPVARVAQLQADVAKVRRLALRKPVAAAMQSTSDLRAFVQRTAAKETTAKYQTAALVALGLLPASIDLPRAVEDAYVSQAAAYYDPATKGFFIVAAPTSELGFDTLAAHELTHALQDQHFDLQAFLTTAPNADALTARRFVVEGDATLAMIAFVVFSKTKQWELGQRQLTVLREQFAPYASVGPKGLVALAQQQAAASPIKDPAFKASLDAMGTIPAVIIAPLLGAYFQGILVVLTAYERRHGWDSVNELYTNPPESTEQVLHPERLFAHYDPPVTVALPDFENADPIASDVIGELVWSVYFSEWTHDGVAHPEHDWGGDRYAVYELKDGTLMVLIATVWDTVNAATAFEEAYRSTLATRYPDTGKKSRERWVVRRAERVFIVDNGTRDILDTVLEATTFKSGR